MMITFTSNIELFVITGIKILYHFNNEGKFDVVISIDKIDIGKFNWYRITKKKITRRATKIQMMSRSLAGFVTS